MNRIGPRASKSRRSDSEYVHTYHDYNVIDRHPGTSQIHLLTYLHKASKSRGSDSEYVHAYHDYNVIDRHPGMSQIHLLTYHKQRTEVSASPESAYSCIIAHSHSTESWCVKGERRICHAFFPRYRDSLACCSQSDEIIKGVVGGIYRRRGST